MKDIPIERNVSLRTTDLVAYQTADKGFAITLRNRLLPRAMRWWARHALRHDRQVFVVGRDDSRLVCQDETEAEALLVTMQREMNRDASSDTP